MKQTIVIPWPSRSLYDCLGREGADWLFDLLDLGPTQGLIDGRGLTWLSYHPKLLECFRVIVETYDVAHWHGETNETFFIHGILSIIFERLYNFLPIDEFRSLLLGDSRAVFDHFLNVEKPPREIAIRHCMSLLAVEFCLGIDGLIAAPQLDSKIRLLHTGLVQQFVHSHKFPEQRAYDGIRINMLAALESFEELSFQTELVEALQVLLRGDRQRFLTRAHLIKDSKRVPRKHIESAQRALERIQRDTARRRDSELRRAFADHSESEQSFGQIGPYSLLDILGEGSMGKVHLARHRNGEVVALKVLKPSLTFDFTEVMRFQREIEVMMTLRHPHIVEILEFGNEEQQSFLALEYCEGGSLLERLEKKEKMSEQDVWGIVYQIASALDFAWSHPKKFVHRDVKAANILFTLDGTAKLTDFGMATGVAPDATRLTMEGASLGTPYCMAPEQFGQGQETDVRSDLWALGVLAFQAMTGHMPFPGPSVFEIIHQVLHEEPRHLQSLNVLSQFTQQTIRKLLQKPANERFQHPKELMETIDASWESLRVQERKKPRARLCLEFDKRRRLFIVSGDTLRFGRQADLPNDICMRPPSNSAESQRTVGISKQHGLLYFDDDQLSIQDTSSNGLFLNNELIGKGSCQYLVDGDTLSLAGRLELQIHYIKGGILITRFNDWKTYAYLWVLDKKIRTSDIFSILTDWPQLPGSILEREGEFYFRTDASAKLGRRQLVRGERIRLRKESTIEGDFGRVKVRGLEWSLFDAGKPRRKRSARRRTVAD